MENTSRILNEKIAIVTGAGRGIGRAISVRLAEQGARVIAISRTMEELQQTVALIEDSGGNAFPFAVDISKQKDIDRVVSETHGSFGRIDILVSNAGMQGPIGPLPQNDTELWIQTLSINLIGTYLTMHAVLPFMIAQGRGKIINLSGGGATGPRPNFSAYGASKAAIVRLTETTAEEMKPYNIQINAVAPGAINTRMLDDVLAAGHIAGTEYAAALKQKETGGSSPDRAAALVVFLASSASDGLTGKLISAIHDDWENWDAVRIHSMSNSAWLTLRRMDTHTLRPFMDKIR